MSILAHYYNNESGCDKKKDTFRLCTQLNLSWRWFQMLKWFKSDQPGKGFLGTATDLWNPWIWTVFTGLRVVRSRPSLNATLVILWLTRVTADITLGNSRDISVYFVGILWSFVLQNHIPLHLGKVFINEYTGTCHMILWKLRRRLLDSLFIQGQSMGRTVLC